MKSSKAALIGLAAALAQITGCSKTSLDQEAAFKSALPERDKRIAELQAKQNQSQPTPSLAASSVSQTMTTPQVRHQTVAERVAEIDRLLNASLTGRPEDADKRVALKAERAALVGSSDDGAKKNRNQAAQSTRNGATQVPAYGQQTLLQDGNIVNYAPAAPSKNTKIVIAPIPAPIYNPTDKELAAEKQAAARAARDAWCAAHPTECAMQKMQWQIYELQMDVHR